MVTHNQCQFKNKISISSGVAITVLIILPLFLMMNLFCFESLHLQETKRDQEIIHGKQIQGANHPYQQQRLKDHNRTLSHVVIPLHEKQLGKLRLNLGIWWVNNPPCSTSITEKEKETVLSHHRPALVFQVSFSVSESVAEPAHDDTHSDNIEKTCLEMFEQPPVRVQKCFASIRVVTLGLSRKDDKHVQGARLMFEDLLQGKVTGDCSYALYMEPDMLPIQSQWLVRITNQVEWPTPEFWMLGSIYRGSIEHVEGTTYLPNKYHINGNAIYNIGSENFRQFYFKQVRPYIVVEHGDSVNAYDTDIYEYLMAPKNYDASRHVMHFFQYTDLMQNKWHSNWFAHQLAANHPNTVLVHGGESSAA